MTYSSLSSAGGVTGLEWHVHAGKGTAQKTHSVVMSPYYLSLRGSPASSQATSALYMCGFSPLFLDGSRMSSVCWHCAGHFINTNLSCPHDSLWGNHYDSCFIGGEIKIWREFAQRVIQELGEPRFSPSGLLQNSYLFCYAVALVWHGNFRMGKLRTPETCWGFY